MIVVVLCCVVNVGARERVSRDRVVKLETTECTETPGKCWKTMLERCKLTWRNAPQVEEVECGRQRRGVANWSERGRARSSVLASRHLKDSLDTTTRYPSNSCNDSNHEGNAER
jgi:hypothetical protein